MGFENFESRMGKRKNHSADIEYLMTRTSFSFEVPNGYQNEGRGPWHQASLRGVPVPRSSGHKKAIHKQPKSVQNGVWAAQWTSKDS